MNQAGGTGEGARDFLTDLRSRAASRSRTLVFAEGLEPRVHEALVHVAREGLFDAVLLGPPDQVRAGVATTGVDPERFRVLDPGEPERVDRAFEALRARREGKGDGEVKLLAMARDPLMQAGLMVGHGDVDGSVAGCVRTTADVVRAGLVCVGLAEGIRTLSSSFYMVFDALHPRGPAVLTFTDAGVVPRPTSDQLAEIAAAAVGARDRVVGDEPRVAFLSYSTKGSADGETVATVREGFEHFRRLMPHVIADGELQGDAALAEDIARRKAPGSPVAGRANVLVFPDLGAANLSYKLVQHLGGAVALGPILQGFARPFNDLSRGADVGDIVAVACITALLAD